MKIEEFFKKLDYFTQNIKEIVLSEENIKNDINSIQNFLPVYRIYKKFGEN
ncbi:MAG: hypothetical protein HRT99_02590 [Mycoplasmatales bacterium]|nr:hypothetical protein [Mycoplasmatales bacterium]